LLKVAAPTKNYTFLINFRRMHPDQKPEKSSEQIKFGHEKLKIFFLSHLDRIYCAKEHLIKKLPELKTWATFKELNQAIEETIANVEKQIARMELIYTLLDAEASDENCSGLKGLVEDAFSAIEKQSQDMELRDMSILFYLQNIESLEMASFQVLSIAAFKLKNNQIKQLLTENFEEAKESRTLLLLISAKYVSR
jgi:ferritin-like metal-binding protein YciE